MFDKRSNIMRSGIVGCHPDEMRGQVINAFAHRSYFEPDAPVYRYSTNVLDSDGGGDSREDNEPNREDEEGNEPNRVPNEPSHDPNGISGGTSSVTNGTNYADNEYNRDGNLKRITGAIAPVTAPVTAPVNEPVSSAKLLLRTICENPGKRKQELVALTGLRPWTVKRLLEGVLRGSVEYRGACRNGGFFVADGSLKA